MSKMFKVAKATSLKAAILVAGVSFEEANNAFDVVIGHFMVDGMDECAYGIYYTLVDDLSGDEMRCFVSFDGNVEGWKNIAEGAMWAFRDLR